MAIEGRAIGKFHEVCSGGNVGEAIAILQHEKGRDNRIFPRRMALVIVVKFGKELVKAIVGIFGEAKAVNAGGESACGGDGTFGDSAQEEEGGSEETDASGDRGGDEGEIGGVAGLADAFLGDVAFDG